MKRSMSVKLMWITLIGFLVGVIVSCGMEKATNIAQVVDGHFKYEDIRYELVKTDEIGGHGGGVWTYSDTRYFYDVSGKITNNSGIYIDRAEFDILFFKDGEQIDDEWFSIREFATGSTREFEASAVVWAPIRNQKKLVDKVEIVYVPRSD